MALDDPLAPMAVMSASISPTSLANNGLGRHSPVGLAIDGEVESDGGSSVDGEGGGDGDGQHSNASVASVASLASLASLASELVEEQVFDGSLPPPPPAATLRLVKSSSDSEQDAGRFERRQR